MLGSQKDRHSSPGLKRKSRGIGALYSCATVFFCYFGLSMAWSLAALAPEDPRPPLEPERSWDAIVTKKESLMVKYMDLDPLGLHGQGRLVLHSLHPLVNTISFDKVTGNPELWLKRMAGFSALANWLVTRQQLGEIKLAGLEVLMTAEGIDFKFDRADIKDGYLLQGRGRFAFDGRWAVRSGALWLSRPPFKDLDKPFARPMGYGTLDAYGAKGRFKAVMDEAFALDASTGHVEANAVWNDAVTRGDIDKVEAEWGVEMTTFRVSDAFFEQGPRDLSHELLTYAGLTPAWGMAFPRITLSGSVTGPSYKAHALRLSSPSLQVWGTAHGIWYPLPGSMNVEVTAKSPGRDMRQFVWPGK
ncbi:MAG: hypothetical protein HQL79_06550 [Magnetococcales bacterium]|nr:hypothetical protein [Magnetococcales bacterium]